MIDFYFWLLNARAVPIVGKHWWISAQI